MHLQKLDGFLEMHIKNGDAAFLFVFISLFYAKQKLLDFQLFYFSAVLLFCSNIWLTSRMRSKMSGVSSSSG